MAGEYHGHILEVGAVRGRSRKSRHRFRSGPRDGAKGAAENNRDRRHRVSAAVGLQEFQRDRKRSRRAAARRHFTCRGTDRRRRASESRAVRRRDHDDHAQDSARSARRDDHVPQRIRRSDRQGGIPRLAGRSAQSHHCGDRRRAEGSVDAGVQRVRKKSGAATPRRSPTSCSRAASASSRAAPTII